MLKKFVLLIFLLTPSLFLFSQKVEVEKKIPERKFPAAAVKWLNDNYDKRKCKRYYLEYDGDTTNFEAKFKYRKVHYSIEFFHDGNLKDIEKRIDFEEMPPDVRKEVTTLFNRDFSKFKIKKVQEQTLPDQFAKRYEIEVKGKGEEETAYFEYLFSASGDLLKRRKIVLPPDNITLY